MRIPTVAILALPFIISSAALATPYQFEMEADYAQAASWSAYGARGRYHYAVVETKDHPLAEAAFLERLGSVSVYAAGSDSDPDFPTDEWMALTADYYFPNTRYYAAASWSSQTRNRGPGILQTLVSANQSWDITLGITPIDGLLVTNTFSEDSGIFDIRVKYVRLLKSETALSIEIDQRLFILDYHIDRTLSLGLSLPMFDGEYLTAGGLRAKKYFTSRLSGQISYAYSQYTDAWSAGLAYRF